MWRKDFPKKISKYISSTVPANTNTHRAAAGSTECCYRAYLLQYFSLAGLTMALICLLQREESRYHTDELHCQCVSVRVHSSVCVHTVCVSLLRTGPPVCTHECLFGYILCVHVCICHSAYCTGVCLSPFTFSTYLDMQTPLCEGVRCE